MCGYTFFFEKNRSLSSKEINKLLTIQKHRGPDSKRFIKSNNNYFFHNRLKIIDPSNRSIQPMEDQNGNIIIFNGEIYNYQELKTKFGINNLKTNSDTEVILELYKKLGKNFVKELNGIFTFIIYEKSKNSLFVVRDRLGIKPLFYFIDSKRIIFSTEIKPILYLLKIYKVNYNNIANYISTGKYFHTDETFFQSIKIFPSSSYKFINLKKNTYFSKKYWKLYKNKNLKCNSYKTFYQEFLKKFNQAMNYNFVSDTKLSLLLSSGKDSLFINEFINKEMKLDINKFTYGWRDKRYDEITRLNKVLNKKNNHFKYKVPINKIFNDLKNIIYKFEGPTGGFGTLGQYYLFKKIKKKGIKVALSGEGSDEFLIGYQNLIKLCQGKNFKKYSNDNIFSPDGRALDDQSLLNNNIKITTNKILFKRIEDVFMNYIFHTKLPKLLIFYDKSSALNSIEGRVPMLDHKLLEFLYSNSILFRLKKKPIDSYFKANRVNFYSNKLNVSTPQREFFKSKKKKAIILKLIKYGKLVKLKILDYIKFENKYNNYLTEKKTTNSFFIWKVLNAELFLRAFDKKFIF